MRAILLGSLALLIGSPVLAADYFYSPGPLEPMDSFEGYGYSSSTWSDQYIGVTLGGQRTRIDVPGNGVLEGNGLIGGVFAGWNFEDNGFVYGAEVDAEWSGFDQSVACSNPAWTCRGYVNAQGSLRGRLGFAADNFHLYGTAGLAIAHVGGSTTSPTNVVYSDSDIRFGWTIGAGAEVALSDDWFVRAEYRYTDLGTRDMTFDVDYPGVRATSHAFRLGAAYKF